MATHRIIIRTADDRIFGDLPATPEGTLTAAFAPARLALMYDQPGAWLELNGRPLDAIAIQNGVLATFDRRTALRSARAILDDHCAARTRCAA